QSYLDSPNFNTVDVVNMNEKLLYYDGIRLYYKNDYGIPDNERYYNIHEREIPKNDLSFEILNTNNIDTKGNFIFSHGNYIITLSNDHISILDIEDDQDTDLLSINTSNSTEIPINENMDIETTAINSGYL